MGDFRPAHIEAVVKHINFTLAVEDEDQVYLTRSFCIFELAVTPSGSLKFPLCGKRAQASRAWKKAEETKARAEDNLETWDKRVDEREERGESYERLKKLKQRALDAYEDAVNAA